MKKTIISFAASALVLAGCTDSNQWKVSGNVEGASGKEMILEASTNGRWYPIDTIAIDDKGNFSASQKAAGYPDIYRLRMEGKSLYFPVDSIESVTIQANAANFEQDYSVSGSTDADNMMAANNRINEAVTQLGVEKALTDSVLKRELSRIIVGNPSGIVAYYIINKNIGGRPLFNPGDRKDVRVIGAVANAFSQLRANDPRTTYLRNLFLANRQFAAGDTIHAEEINLFDINLYDEKGKKHSLVELSKEGKVILLNFAVYGAEYSPAYNLALNELYKRYHGQGLEIYQVSVDDDEFAWKQSAKNLPWITVYNSPADGSVNLMRYNVQTLPTTFIINRKGELVERVEDVTKLPSKLVSYM